MALAGRRLLIDDFALCSDGRLPEKFASASSSASPAAENTVLFQREKAGFYARPRQPHEDGGGHGDADAPSSSQLLKSLPCVPREIGGDAMASFQPQSRRSQQPDAARAMTTDNRRKPNADHGAKLRSGANSSGFVAQMALSGGAGSRIVLPAIKHMIDARRKELASAVRVEEMVSMALWLRCRI